MKKNSYFTKSVLGLSLISGIAFAADIELNDDNGKDLNIKSSIQLKGKKKKKEENLAAKIDVSDVCKILKKNESGKIIKIDLENEDGNLVYRSEILKDSGENIDLIVDAGNGQILYKSVDNPDKENESENENEKD